MLKDSIFNPLGWSKPEEIPIGDFLKDTGGNFIFQNGTTDKISIL